MAALPTLTVEEAFTTAPFAATPTFTAIASTFLHNLSISRGGSPNSDRFPAGSADGLFDNRDRRFDSTYASSPYSPNLIPDKRIRYRTTFNAVTYDLFEGFVDGHIPEYELGSQERASIPAHDGFKLLARYKLTGLAARPAELSSARVTAILDHVGWPATRRAISTGGATLAADPEIAEQYALDALIGIDLTEGGRLFIDQAGMVTLLSRGDMQTSARQTTSQFTFGDGNTAAEIPYAAVVFDDSAEVLWNSVTITHPTFDPITVEDATSKAAHGPITEERRVFDATQAGMRATAERLLAEGKDPVQRVTGITLKPAYTDANFPNHLFAQAFSIRLADRVTVKRRPVVGAVKTIECHVQSIRHTIPEDPADWTVDVGLKYAPPAITYATWGAGFWGTGKWGY